MGNHADRDPLTDPQPGDLVEWARDAGDPPFRIMVVGRRAPDEPPHPVGPGRGSVVEVLVEGLEAFFTLDEWVAQRPRARVVSARP